MDDNPGATVPECAPSSPVADSCLDRPASVSRNDAANHHEDHDQGGPLGAGCSSATVKATDSTTVDGCCSVKLTQGCCAPQTQVTKVVSSSICGDNGSACCNITANTSEGINPPACNAGGEKEKEKEKEAAFPPPSAENSAPTGCCSAQKQPKGSEENSASMGCCSAQKQPKVSADNSASAGCCSGQKQPKEENSGNSSCCIDKASCNPSPDFAKIDHASSCCSEPSVLEIEDPNNPDCCKGKDGSCCDASCLDRIALRQCDVSGGMSSPNSSHEGAS